VTARNVFQARIKKLVKDKGLTHRVHFLNFLSDEKLAFEIQSSQALIQPSLSEGFGLTGLEAMSLNTPVLASSILVFKEVYQNGAIYFDPYSSLSLIKAIKHLNKIKPKSAIVKKVVNQYSWDQMARQTFELIIRQASK
jgi:glycosyltransferase involved in cell wall biosynthesis